jgi:hypothetical protein
MEKLKVKRHEYNCKGRKGYIYIDIENDKARKELLSEIKKELKSGKLTMAEAHRKVKKFDFKNKVEVRFDPDKMELIK